MLQREVAAVAAREVVVNEETCARLPDALFPRSVQCICVYILRKKSVDFC